MQCGQMASAQTVVDFFNDGTMVASLFTGEITVSASKVCWAGGGMSIKNHHETYANVTKDTLSVRIYHTMQSVTLTVQRPGR